MALFALKQESRAAEEAQLNVHLRPLSIADKMNIRKWMSDTEILQLTFVVPGPGNIGATPFTPAASDHYLNVLIEDPRRYTFAIEVNGSHVGNIGLKEFDKERATTEFFVEIGEREYRGKGVGKAAMACLFDYAFWSHGVSEVRLEVLEFNTVAIRAYHSLGFIRTHRTGWHYDPQGRYWQVWGMHLSKDRWVQTRKSNFLPSHITLVPLTEF